MKKISYYIEGVKTGRISLKNVLKYYKTTYRYEKFQKLKHPFVKTLYKTKMYLNPKDNIISKFLYMNKCWEPQETEYFKKIVLEGMNVIDIGANIGYFSILFSKWIGDRGKVFAFEPDPKNYELLIKNIQANKCTNISPIKKAVSNYDGKTFLFLSDENIGDHRIFDANIFPGDEIRNKIEIESIRLDSFFLPEQEIDLIKMDIQGSEMLALEGMNQILSRNHKIFLFTEFWPIAIEKSGRSPKEYLEKLHQLGFKIYSLNKNEKITISSYDFDEKNYGSKFINLICEKK